MTSTFPRSFLTALMILALALGLAACGSDGSSASSASGDVGMDDPFGALPAESVESGAIGEWQIAAVVTDSDCADVLATGEELSFEITVDESGCAVGDGSDSETAGVSLDISCEAGGGEAMVYLESTITDDESGCEMNSAELYQMIVMDDGTMGGTFEIELGLNDACGAESSYCTFSGTLTGEMTSDDSVGDIATTDEDETAAEESASTESTDDAAAETSDENTDATGDESAGDSSTETSEETSESETFTGDATLTVDSLSGTISAGGEMSVSFQVDNATNVENFVVDVRLFYLGSVLGGGSGFSYGGGSVIGDSYSPKSTPSIAVGKGTVLDAQDITVTAGSNADFALGFTVPDDLEGGRYSARVRLKYVSEEGVTTLLDYSELMTVKVE